MDSNKTFRIIVIVSTLFTFLTPAESEYVSLRNPFVARSLLSVIESPSPAPGPTTVSENPPADLEPPAASPEDSADSDYPTDPPANSPAEADVDSPAASPEAPEASPEAPAASPEAPADCDSPTNSPANPPTEADIDFPAASPGAPTGSDSRMSSPANSPAPAASPVAPAVSDSPTNSPANPPADENAVAPSPTAPSGKTLMSSSKDPLKQPLLSPEIKTICGKTDNPPLCESSISSLLTAETKPDASSVLLLAIQASVNATKAAMATVEKVSATECQELYDDAVTNLEDAINSVNSRDIDTVNTNLSAAMTDYSTCNDGFEESGEPNPLADVSDKLTKMVSNCLAISTLIK